MAGAGAEQEPRVYNRKNRYRGLNRNQYNRITISAEPEARANDSGRHQAQDKGRADDTIKRQQAQDKGRADDTIKKLE
jgi:hypothetical protein